MYQRCIHLASKQNKYLRFVRNRLTKHVSVFRELVVCVPRILTPAYPPESVHLPLPSQGHLEVVQVQLRAFVKPFPAHLRSSYPTYCYSYFLLYGWPDWTGLQWDNVLIQYYSVLLTYLHHDMDLTEKCPDFDLLDHFSQLEHVV